MGDITKGYDTLNKGSLVYVTGDLFAEVTSDSNVVLSHVCNDKGGFGSGFVVPLAKHFPDVRNQYRDLYDGGKCFRGLTQFVEIGNLTVANMISQTLGGMRPLYYNALANCMDDVAQYAIEHDKEVVGPLFGSQLAGGDWNIIEKLIEDCWLRAGVNVTIYQLPGQEERPSTRSETINGN